MAIEGLAQAIDRARRAREDGLVGEVASKIGGEFAGAVVATAAFLGEGLQDDPVEVAAQVFAQPLAIEFAEDSKLFVPLEHAHLVTRYAVPD